MSQDLLQNERAFIDCSQNGDGLTLEAIVRMVMAHGRTRLDDVIISPTTVAGKLVLHIEIDQRLRDNTTEPLYLDFE